ncbi:MAG: YraN family protein [Propionibacteriaceae bacterium]|nr:YraN family protein [Propionibacteriaceae bacterium]
MTGKRGEDLAARHLRALGWRIVERNWRCSQGELDIVALEPRPDGAPARVVAVEVKTRSGSGYGDPLEAITVAKLRRLRGLATRWYREHPGVGQGLRLDAVGIVKPVGMAPMLTHVRGL